MSFRIPLHLSQNLSFLKSVSCNELLKCITHLLFSQWINPNVCPSSCTAKIYPYKRKEVLKWATKIAERYVGRKKAKAYGRRNSGEGAVLVKINSAKIIAEKDIASWD
jgi:hypothetical protein